MIVRLRQMIANKHVDYIENNQSDFRLPEFSFYTYISTRKAGQLNVNKSVKRKQEKSAVMTMRSGLSRKATLGILFCKGKIGISDCFIYTFRCRQK